MHSKHAVTLLLLVAGAALVVVLGAVLSLELVHLAGPQAPRAVTTETPKIKYGKPPRLFTKIEGTDAVIVEVDDKGDTTRVVHTSSLVDPIADFTLFAIPQDHYQGTAYVRSLPDAETAQLIVYPLNVEAGTLGQSVLNTPADAHTLSTNQERVAVIDVGTSRKINLFDLTTGALLTDWVLAEDEWLEPTPKANVYSGTGVRWVNEQCFEHTIWIGNPRLEATLTTQEIRMFCVEEV